MRMKILDFLKQTHIIYEKAKNEMTQNFAIPFNLDVHLWNPRISEFWLVALPRISDLLFLLPPLVKS